MKVHLVHLHDRHCDDVFTVHANAESADREVSAIKDGYAEHGVEQGEWTQSLRPNAWQCGDDGPLICVSEIEVKP